MRSSATGFMCPNELAPQIQFFGVVRFFLRSVKFLFTLTKKTARKRLLAGDATSAETHPIAFEREPSNVRESRSSSPLDNEARAELLRLCRRKVVPAHHAIFRDGDGADHYYNITSGIVKLVKTLADGRAAYRRPALCLGFHGAIAQDPPYLRCRVGDRRRSLRLPKSPFRRVHDVAP